MKSAWFVRIVAGPAALLASGLLWLLSKTLRWRLIELAAAKDFWCEAKPCIFVFWHSRQLIMPFLYNRMGATRHVSTLISGHRDGRMIARTVRYLGIDSVEGSSTRGGSRALMALMQALKNGSNVGITPDGPRGPARKLKWGVLFLASSCGIPVYPIAYSAKPVWTFRSWDRMILPKPFSRVVGAVGAPIVIEKDLPGERWAEVAAKVEKRLNELTDLVDSYEF